MQGRAFFFATRPSSLATLVWKQHYDAAAHVDFAALYGTPAEDKVAYAVCYVHADADRDDLVLGAGSDDQAKLYINGVEVYRQPRARGLRLDEDKISPRLKKGINVLVLKVVNGISLGPEACLHFMTKDGRPADGLRFGVEPE